MKKIATALCAFALTLAFPMSAFAYYSGGNDYPEYPEGPDYITSGVVSQYGDNGEIFITGDDLAIFGAGVTSSTASNVPSSSTVIGSYYINGEIFEGTATISIFLGPEYANKTVGVWIQHEDGTTEAYNVTADASGTIALTMSKFSVITVTENLVPGIAPKTGIDDTAVLLCTAGSLFIAAGAAYALRKKVTA